MDADRQQQALNDLVAEVAVGIEQAQVREASGWVVLVTDLESGKHNAVYGDFDSPEQALTWAAEHDADPNGGRVVEGDQPGWSHTVLPRFEVKP